MAREMVIEAAPGTERLSSGDQLADNAALVAALKDAGCKEAAAALAELDSALANISNACSPGKMLSHAGIDLYEESKLANDPAVSLSLFTEAQSALAQTAAKLRSGISFDLECLGEQSRSKLRRHRRSGLLEYVSAELPKDIASLHLASTLKATLYAERGEIDVALSVLARHSSSLASLLAHGGWRRCEKVDRAAIGKASEAATALSQISSSSIGENEGEPACPR